MTSDILVAFISIFDSSVLLRSPSVKIPARWLSLSTTAVVDKDNHLAGIFTDGDLRRTLESNIDIKATKMSDVMTANPFVLSEDTLAYNAVNLIQEKKITSVIVTKENKVIGAPMTLFSLVTITEVIFFS